MDDYFRKTRINENVIQLQDLFGNCASLIMGTERAILFDTMIGIGNLRKCVEEITALPLTVINSHGHIDHVGGNYQFDNIHLNRRDWPLIADNLQKIDVIEQNYGHDLSHAAESLRHMERKIQDIVPGTVINLGDLTLEVIKLEGHTGGSTGLFIREQKLLLAGDAFTPQMCLFFPESLSTEKYIRMLKRTQKLKFNTFLLGHFGSPFEKKVLDLFQQCAEMSFRGKWGDFEYSLIPQYMGKVYIMDYRNPQIDEMICLISKK